MLSNIKIHSQMKSNTKAIFTIMHVLFWIIFIGLCFESGTFLFSMVLGFIFKPENLYLKNFLKELKEANVIYYINVASLLALISGLKAYMAYLVILIFLKFNIADPFSKYTSKLISRISYIALVTGILAFIASGYCDWLNHRGLKAPEEWAASELLFLAGIIFIIAQVFKKGIELKSENDLTI